MTMMRDAQRKQRVFNAPIKKNRAPMYELDPEYREAVLNLPQRDIRPSISLLTIRNDIFVLDMTTFIDIFNIVGYASKLDFPRLEWDEESYRVIIPEGEKNYLYFFMKCNKLDIAVCLSEIERLYCNKFKSSKQKPETSA
jgi:hypothetical protein